MDTVFFVKMLLVSGATFWCAATMLHLIDNQKEPDWFDKIFIIIALASMISIPISIIGIIVTA